MTATRRGGCRAGWVNSCYANIPRMNQRTEQLALTMAATVTGLAACLLTAAVLVGWWS